MRFPVPNASIPLVLARFAYDNEIQRPPPPLPRLGHGKTRLAINFARVQLKNMAPLAHILPHDWTVPLRSRLVADFLPTVALLAVRLPPAAFYRSPLLAGLLGSRRTGNFLPNARIDNLQMNV